MGYGLLSGCIMALALCVQPALGQETLIFVRHGEKPTGHSGQLTCKGLNRALSLPQVLLSRYGKPDYIFAAGPKEDKLGNSLRPLSTIMPTAVQLDLPINIQFHADDIDGLEQELNSDKYQDSRVFIAWEHKNLDKIVKNIVKHQGGDPAQVPHWAGDDFDSIFIITLDTSAATNKVKFHVDAENLKQLSSSCPTGSTAG